MKLIVGLGNPGRRYQGTRHNVGFEVLAVVAQRHSDQQPKTRFQGELVEANVGGERVQVLCPHTYMNLSGRSVRAAVDFFQLPVGELLVVCDDFHLPLAKLRFRARGSAGGQKGLADIIRHLGTEEFSRLRVGVGTPPANWRGADYVLSRFSKAEALEIQAAVQRAADATADWAVHGIEYCMNLYNGT
jgi:PTH1 family peptidyl-tRNA hydrolase